MTINVLNAKTKSELRAHPERATFKDPAVVNPIAGGTLFTLNSLLTVRDSINFTCTNHPKRSWFAIVSATHKGITVK
jgi:hypothetical protein